MGGPTQARITYLKEITIFKVLYINTLNNCNSNKNLIFVLTSVLTNENN
jgi:hypothetical protein